MEIDLTEDDILKVIDGLERKCIYGEDDCKCDRLARTAEDHESSWRPPVRIHLSEAGEKLIAFLKRWEDT